MAQSKGTLTEQATADLSYSHFISIQHHEFRTLSEGLRLVQELALLCPKPSLASIGLNEIFINAVEHGNLDIDFNEKASFASPQAWLEEVNRRLTLKENIRKKVTVKVERSPYAIVFTVEDCGYGFDWTKFQSLDKLPIMNRNGRGLYIATQMGFDKVRFIPPGNKVECTIYRPTALANSLWAAEPPSP